MRNIVVLWCIFLTSILISSCSQSSESNNSETQVIIGPSKTIPTPSFWSGKHTLEIFADFQCPACQSFSKNIGPIFESYAQSGMLTIEFRQFPLTSPHKNAYRDAIAALCSADQGKYMEAKKALYNLEEQKSGRKVNDLDRINILVSAWVQRDSLEKCLKENTFKEQVDSDMAYGKKLRITGTPTVFLDKNKLDMSSFQDIATLKSFLDKYLTEK